MFFIMGCSKSDYNNAIDMFNNGNYASAALIFEKLGNYKDSSVFLTICNYNIAVTEYENKNYEIALAIFNILGDYKDCAEMIEMCSYELGVEAFENEDYDTAAPYFYGLGNFKNSKEMYKLCKYNNLVSYIIKNGKYLCENKWYYFEELDGANAYHFFITDGDVVMYKYLASWETYDSDFFFGYTCTYTTESLPYYCLQYYDCELTNGVITDGEAVDIEGHIDVATGRIIDIQSQEIVNTDLSFAKEMVTETQERSLEFVKSIIARSEIGITLEELFG